MSPKRRYSFQQAPGNLEGLVKPEDLASPLGGVTMEELEKLDRMMLVVAVLGIVVNVVQFVVSRTHAWVTSSALHDGQLFTAHLSLDTVQFGTVEDPGRDNAVFCSHHRPCSLSDLCRAPADDSKYERTGLLKSTQPTAWCDFESAGALTASLLTLSLLIGLVATGITLMYASQSIPWVALQFDKIEELGFSDTIQKSVMCACWIAVWCFVFASMACYAMYIPDSLGWGTVDLDASFGLLRLCFTLCSFNCALMVNSLYHGEEDLPPEIKEVWADFSTAKWLSSKKVLYLLLVTQLICYLLMLVAEVDWSVLLVVIAFFYVIADDKRFMVMYVVLVTVSMLFDSLRAAKLSHPEQMSSGDQFGTALWVVVFAIKPLVLLAIIAQEKFAAKDEYNSMWARFDDEYSG